MKKRVIKQTAYSLLELLIVLTLIAVLTGLGINTWQNWSAQQAQQVVIAKLTQGLNFARQAAIAKRQQVTVCATKTTFSCGEDWSQGVLIFLDPDNQQQPTEQNMLMRIPKLAKQQQLVWRGWLNHTVVRFMADGVPHSYHGTFYWVMASKEQPLLVLNAAGRIRVAK